MEVEEESREGRVGGEHETRRRRGGDRGVRERRGQTLPTCHLLQFRILTGNDAGLDQHWGSKPHICSYLHQLPPLQGTSQTLTCARINITLKLPRYQ